MLRILLGSDQRAILDAILKQVCQNADQGIKGQLLIVPEQYSHAIERKLCEVGGDTICLSAEVLSFSRLSSRVCTLYGGVCRKTLDRGGQVLAMAAALEAVSSRLKLYGASRRKPEFLLRLLTVLEELKGACINAEQLKQAAVFVGGRLAVKLEELALALESFQTVCATMGQDANDRMAQLHEILEQHPYALQRTIYIFGFSDFTGQELDVIEALLDGAQNTYIGLIGTADDVGGPFALFSDTMRRLRRRADACGTACEVMPLPERMADGTLLHLKKGLFSSAGVPWVGEAEGLLLHRSTGVYGACMDVAGKIQNLAFNGWRYRDMAVCCTNPGCELPILRSVFERFHIPAYFSGPEAIESSPVISAVMAALEAATGGMEMEAVLRFLKSGLSPLDDTACDFLENYARTWKIRGRKWESAWDMHPDGYGATEDDDSRARLEALNQSRLCGVSPLLKLREDLQRAENTGEQVLAFYDFLDRIGLADTLQQLEASCKTEQELQRAQAYGQMFETVLDALEQVYRILGATVRTPEDFSQMLSAVLAQYTVGTIPSNLDSVDVGGLADMRFAMPRALFVLGADDGFFPAYQAENDLLNEQERKELLSIGLGVAPGQSLRLDRELTGIYQVLTSCSERLYVNACAEQPSYLFVRMQSLFPTVSLEEDAVIPDVLYFQPKALGAFLAGSVEPEALAVLQESAVGKSVADAAAAVCGQSAHQMGKLRPDGVRGLYGQKLYLSASRIDQYAACRCAYYLHYGLKLKPQKEAAFDAPAYGTFVHSVLEQTARAVCAEGGFHAVTEERLEAIAREKIDAYRDDTLGRMLERSERFSYLFQRNLEEVLAVVRELGRELRCSDFEPAGFEVEFSIAGEMQPIQVAGTEAIAEVSGFVDRVDLYTLGGTTYVRVVDYKTGKKAFDYTDILNGMGLQMLIYLFALEEHGENLFGRKLTPAGVLYFPARRVLLPATSKLSAEAAAMKRQSESVRRGLLSDEPAVLGAMEHFERAPVFMPYKISAKGELVGDLANPSELQLLRRHVTRVLAQMADDLAGGSVEPNPIVRGPDSTACAYCDYAQVCHLASGEVAERPMQKTDRNTFWEKLRKEDRGG